MTPSEFVLEQWKVYEAYIQRKEHLIEVTVTLYLALVGTLLLQGDSFWAKHVREVFLVWLPTALFVLLFVAWQMHLRHQGTRISEASQSLLGQWLYSPPLPWDPRLKSERRADFSGVEFPKVLIDEMDVPRHVGCGANLKALLFAVVVYGLLLVWTLALLARIHRAWVLGC